MGMPTDTTPLSNREKILVVEDDVFLQNLIAQGITSHGYKLSIAKDGSVALALLEKEIPNIILCDIVLPGMSGFEILEKVKSQDKTKNIPVIMLSNLSHQSDIDKAFKLGAAAYLVKSSTSPAEIIAKIKEFLDAA
jgi:DNA-binding response OmpR family regulator